MARPQAADRDGLKIWRLGANILNKQSRTSDRGRPSNLGANKPQPLKIMCHEMKIREFRENLKSHLLRDVQQSLELGRILWHNLITGKWI
jgi:hypothetical protein